MARWKKKDIKDKNVQEQLGEAPKRPKFGNIPTRTADGEMAASKLEAYAYDTFKKLGLKFDFQKEVMLQKGFTEPTGGNVRPIKMRPDFLFRDGSVDIFADTKGGGTSTAVFDIKLKLLKKKYKLLNRRQKFIILKSKKEIVNFALLLKSKQLKK